MRVIVDETVGANSQRFKFTKHDDQTIVVENQLHPLDLKSLHQWDQGDEYIKFEAKSVDEVDEYEYLVYMSPFRIEQRVNGITTIIVNKHDTLTFENYQRFYNENLAQKV